MERVSILGFILVVLYLITREIACDEVNSIESSREALLDLKNGLKGPNNRLLSWNGSDYCHWQGIICEDGTKIIISIDLHNPYNSEYVVGNRSSMSLSGEIKPSLIKLKFLRYVDLSFNSFNDIPIPTFFGSLKNLQYLNLSNAGFSGVIPPNFGNLSNLQYLDLSSGYSNLYAHNLEWMIGLVSLKHLEMNFVNLSLIGTRWVEILNKLSVLTELHLYACSLLVPISPSTLIKFTSLAVIDIGHNNFNYKFPKWLLNISSLVSISISHAELQGTFPLSEVPNLQYLDLSGNNFNSIDLVINSCNLKYLDLSDNSLGGSLKVEYLNGSENCGSQMLFLNLMHLDLSLNQLQGFVPNSIEKLYNLKYVDLDYNQLSGELPEWLGELKNLVTLHLSDNKIEGPVPASLGRLQHLEDLRLGGNRLNGSLPTSIGNLSQLQFLDVSENELSGSITSQHLSKLHKLEIVDMSYNSFHLNVSSDWVPLFQLKELYMDSCHVGPVFPTWLHSQKKLETLSLSNANISGSIPNWFWKFSSNIVQLILSSNQLNGELPISLNFFGDAIIDFSSNFLEGPIPFPIYGVSLLSLSNNNFSGAFPSSKNESMPAFRYLSLLGNQITGVIPFNIGESMSGLSFLSLSSNQITGTIPFNIGQSMPNLKFLSLSGNQITGTIPDSIGHMTSIQVIDFSKNNLGGSIPSTIYNCSQLVVLDLGNNNLCGMIPESLGLLPSLRSLHLNHNKLSGQLPSSFRNLSTLLVFDLSYNKLSGNIPAWIGTSFMDLKILNLRWNMFCGRLPSKLSNLSSLHVLDLAHNHLTSNIPVTLLQLEAMTQRQDIVYSLSMNESVYYEERLILNTKGQSLEYTRTLSLVISIDLSDNSLSGEFPEEITKLSGLMVLNLSRNHIGGQIPRSISRLHELSSLDLSSNNLSGIIPSTMPDLTFLECLNLSNNNFSGKIPYEGQMTTFFESAFVGNPNLCGDPLAMKCQGEDSNKGHGATTTAIDEDEKEDDSLVDQWFYLSIGLGFAAGVLLPYFLIAINTSLYDLYFHFVDNIVCKLFLPKGKRRTSC